MGSIHGSLDQLQPLATVSVGLYESPAPRLTCAALLDTGATRTCLTAKVIAQLGLPARGKLLVSSATSYPERRRAYGYSLGLFCQTPTAAQTLYVLLFELVAPPFQDNDNFDVLLGMDILSRGRLVFEPDHTFAFTFDF